MPIWNPYIFWMSLLGSVKSWLKLCLSQDFLVTFKFFLLAVFSSSWDELWGLVKNTQKKKMMILLSCVFLKTSVIYCNISCTGNLLLTKTACLTRKSQNITISVPKNFRHYNTIHTILHLTDKLQTNLLIPALLPLSKCMLFLSKDYRDWKKVMRAIFFPSQNNFSIYLSKYGNVNEQIQHFFKIIYRK